MAPIVSAVQAAMPTTAPIKGMAHNGRTAYAKPKVASYARPQARSRKTAYIPIIGFKATGVGFAYAELAGIQRRAPRPVSKGWNSTSVGYHSYQLNGQGGAFIQRLERIYAKPGRFFFREVLKDLPRVRRKIRGILEDRTKQLNRKLRG